MILPMGEKKNLPVYRHPEIILAVKKAACWEVTPGWSCNSRRFRGKRQFLKKSHGSTSQNTAFFTVAAVNTSNILFKLFKSWCLLHVRSTARAVKDYVHARDQLRLATLLTMRRYQVLHPTGPT
jgi:hypothetical protein